jgi:hypothetical protein
MCEIVVARPDSASCFNVIQWLSVLHLPHFDRSGAGAHQPEKSPPARVSWLCSGRDARAVRLLRRKATSITQHRAASPLAELPTSTPSCPITDGFVWMPPGTCTIDSPPTEVDRNDDEDPQTVVTMSRGVIAPLIRLRTR